jgi:hypothetical protein
MKKVFYILSIFLCLCSCRDKAQKNAPVTITSQYDNHKILSETAFIKLDNYEYQDSTNGDFSGGSKRKRTLKIWGSSNFPNGTVITINLSGFIISSKESGIPDTKEDIKVQDGKFLVILHPWNIPDSIDFRVFVNEQGTDVTDIIGKIGEKIKIDLTNKEEFEGITIYKMTGCAVNEDIISTIKKGKSITYNFQKASNFDKSYEKALAEFIKKWKDRDWVSMSNNCQTSQNITPYSLERDFSMIQIYGFEIIPPYESDSPKTLMEVNFSLYVKIKGAAMIKGIYKKTLKANVIRENGKWGVNTISVTRGLYD